MVRPGLPPHRSPRHGPYHQGALDGLCGLYSAVNAICFVLAPHKPMNRAHAGVLFRRGISHLRDRGRLAEAIKRGMNPKWLRQLTQDLARCARKLTGIAVAVEQPSQLATSPSRQALLDLLDAALDRGAVVIVGLENTYSHYTVVCGRKEQRYTLFDSDSLRWIHRESLGMLSARGTRRHQVHRKAVLLVSAEASSP
jgi:hypothetical protein